MRDIHQDAPGSNRLPPLPGEPDPGEVFARRLRVLRETAGLTQRQLADLMTGAGWRMHQTTITKIEAGERPVVIGEAVAFASALGLELADLLAEETNIRERREVMKALAEAERWERKLTELRIQTAAAEEALAGARVRLRMARDELQRAHDRVEGTRADRSGE